MLRDSKRLPAGLPVMSLAVPLLFAAAGTLRGDDVRKADNPATVQEQETEAVRRALADAADQPCDVTKLVVGQARPSLLRIESTLDQLIEVQFIDTPLRDAVAFIRDFYRIEILLDTTAISEGADPLLADTPINLVLSRISLRSLFNLMFEQVPTEELAWIIEDEVMKITTKDDAENSVEVHLYDVQLLQEAGYTPDELKSLLETTVRPKSWKGDEAKGAISTIGNGLVIAQTQPGHREVLDLLVQLHKLESFRGPKEH